MTLDEIRPFISVELPGAPTPVIDAAVILTIRDFLRRSEAWRETLTLDWTQTPTLTPTAANSSVVTVQKVYDTEREIPVPFKTDEQLRDEAYAWANAAGEPYAWTLTEENVLKVYPAPTAEATVLGRLDVTISVNVDASGTFNLPQALWDRYEDAFRNGSLSRIMKIPGRDWTDDRRAAAYGLAYESAVADAKIRGQANFGRPVRTTGYGGI